jgi:hypothetical protein
MIFKRAKIGKFFGPDLPVIYNLHLCYLKNKNIRDNALSVNVQIMIA